MSHTVIIIDSVTPSAVTAQSAEEDPEFSVNVTYRPAHGLTPAQIGNEVARIQRRINQIIEGTAD